MNHTDAVSLIRAGVANKGGVWADLGAGSGVFTRALADLLGPEGQVFAVDRQPSHLAEREPERGTIIPLQADFTRALELPPLDGLLMANALHFVRRHERVLRGLVRHLKPGGTFLLVEYDLSRGSPWIPFPVPFGRFQTLAPRVGLSEVREVGRRPSRYGPRELYAAVAVKQS